jgi:hypothetical protein
VSSSRARLEAYLSHRLARSGACLSGSAAGPALLRELAATVLPDVDKSTWQRRPSISDDGLPIVLSWKAGHGRDEMVRVLIESGSLQMKVAEQISYSLSRLDEVLGVLSWRSAAEDLNMIASHVFPVDASATDGWRGGMWLGAEVAPDSSAVELRLYLNLRHGDAIQRWRRLTCLVTSFSSEAIVPALARWVERVSMHALPVGLGVVVAGGRVRGIRAYLGVTTPTVESISSMCGDLSAGSKMRLESACNGFASRFGSMREQSVTIGYDFASGQDGSASTFTRVKVDICCHLIPADLEPLLTPWTQELLQTWSLKSEPFDQFRTDVHQFWPASQIQFVSLGFSPDPEHVTIYVKPAN